MTCASRGVENADKLSCEAMRLAKEAVVCCASDPLVTIEEPRCVDVARLVLQKPVCCSQKSHAPFLHCFLDSLFLTSDKSQYKAIRSNAQLQFGSTWQTQLDSCFMRSKGPKSARSADSPSIFARSFPARI